MLNGSQHEKLFVALKRAFPTPESLERMVRHRLGENLYEIGYGDLQNLVFRLIEWAQAQGRLTELVLGAHQSNPSNVELFNIAQELSLAIPTPPRRELQRIIKASNGFLDVNDWWTKLAILENQICRVEIKLDNHQWAYGTGFLIGPDVVITNYHVMKYVIEQTQRRSNDERWANEKDVVLRFDYKIISGQDYENSGTIIRLDSNEWLIDSSPMSPYDEEPNPTGIPTMRQLDYALLRVEGSPGNDPIGNEIQDGNNRGWIKIPENSHEIIPNSALIIIQHPRGGPLKLALDTEGIIGQNINGTRLWYRTNTEAGSSGSPCFNINWDLIAIHHTGDPDFSVGHQPLYNQGVPIGAIRARLEERDLLGEINN